jgi:hypothetical protein
MPIYTNNLVIQGALQDTGLYANTVTGSNNALTIMSDVAVNGNVFTTGRVDISDTMYMTMRSTSNVLMGGNEHYVTNSDMSLDAQNSDASVLGQMADVYSIWDWNTGKFTVPLDGLYTLQLQGSFSNSPGAEDAINGVYFYYRNHAYPDARSAANMTRSPLVFTSTTQYLLKGDIVQPAFYSTDSNAILYGNGETFLNFLIQNTVSVSHSNYYRLPPPV